MYSIMILYGVKSQVGSLGQQVQRHLIKFYLSRFRLGRATKKWAPVVGWSDNALLAIFENGHIAED